MTGTITHIDRTTGEVRLKLDSVGDAQDLYVGENVPLCIAGSWYTTLISEPRGNPFVSLSAAILGTPEGPLFQLRAEDHAGRAYGGDIEFRAHVEFVEEFGAQLIELARASARSHRSAVSLSTSRARPKP